MLKSHIFIMLLCGCDVFVHGQDLCSVDVSYSCNNISPDGFCQNETAKAFFPPISSSSVNEKGFILTSSKQNTSKFLQPTNAVFCWNNTCCDNPCDPNPCYNGGVCSNETETGKAFNCSCAPEYRGTWCEEPSTCGGKTCDGNATCIEDKCKCKEGFLGNGVYCQESCSRETIYLKKCDNFFIFDAAVEDVTRYSTVKCNNGESIASVKCVKSKSLKFDESTASCVSCDTTLDKVLHEKVSKDDNVSVIEDKVDKLQLLTSATNESEVETVTNVVNYLEELSTALKTTNATSRPKKINKKTMKNVLLVVEHLNSALPPTTITGNPTRNNLEQKASESKKSKEIRDSTRETLKLIDNFARSVDLSGKKELTIQTENMALKISKPDVSNGTTFAPEMNARSITAEDTTTPITRKKQVVRMQIPPEALRSMADLAASSGDGDLKLVFVLHKDSSLLTLDKRTGRVVQATYKEDNGSSEEHTNIGATFSIAFNDPLKPTPAQKATVTGTLLRIVPTYICVFWDFLHEKWETQGCTFHKEGFYCECEHFTSFALMLRVNKDYPIYKPDWYSIIMCSLSILGLAATIIIYLSIKDLRSRRPTPILINISFNLLLGFLVFVIGMDGRSHYKDYSDVACYVFAVIMHVTFLCSWFWMLIYSLNIYYALVRVVGPSPIVSRKVFMYVFGYVVPILIVAIDLIVSFVMDSQRDLTDPNEKDTDKSYYIANHICWIRHYSMYIGFAAPVGLILLINTVLFVVIIRKLTWKRQEIRSSKEKADVKQQMFMAITMMSMMGLTWIFGFFMLLSENETFQTVFSVTFNIFNTAQGVVIFLVSCVKQEAVRMMWVTPIQKRCGCHKSQRDIRAKSFQFETGDTSAFSSTLPRSGKDTTTLSSTML